TPDCADGSSALLKRVAALPDDVDRALDGFDLRRACAAITSLVTQANRYVEDERPWELARAERSSAADVTRLDRVLATLVVTCRLLAEEIGPFIPQAAQRLRDQLGSNVWVGIGRPVFPACTWTSLELEPYSKHDGHGLLQVDDRRARPALRCGALSAEIL
nr:hypothetical protein [Propionibacteriaceae bacterium]